MPGDLSLLHISNSYQSLIHTETNQATVSGTYVNLVDGVGNPMNISVNGYGISSSFTGSLLGTASYVDVAGNNITVNWFGSQLQLTGSSGGGGGTPIDITGFMSSSTFNSWTGNSFNPVTSSLNSLNNYTGSYATTASLQRVIDYTGSFATTASFQRVLDYTGSFATTSSNVFIGSQTITGSTYGNVVSMSFDSLGTASMDLSKGNIFYMELSSSYTSSLGVQNIRPGQTAVLRIKQVASPNFGELNWTSSIKMPYLNEYTSSKVSEAVDIISFVSFDGTSLYAVPANNLR